MGRKQVTPSLEADVQFRKAAPICVLADAISRYKRDSEAALKDGNSRDGNPDVRGDGP
jgi:hypothetical protein